MKAGVIASIGIHVAAVAFGVVSLSAPRLPEVAEIEALPIDIVPIESITKTIEGDKKSDPSKEPAPKPTTKPEVVENAENVGDTKTDIKAEAPKETVEPPVEKTEAPAAKPEPRPEPKPTPVPTPELKIEPKPETKVAILETKPEVVEPIPEETVEESFKTPERVTRPKKRPEKPKPETAQTNQRKDTKKVSEEVTKKADKKKKADKIAALLNKERSSAGGAKRSKKKAALGTKNGKDVKLSTSEMDQLRSYIESCWNYGSIVGNENADNLRATAEFKIDKNGMLEGKPEVTATGGDSRANRAMKGGIKRAIAKCKEFPMLKNKYDAGEQLVVNFQIPDQ